MTRIFGIRHHGPGSAQSLLRALEEMQPDALLIEGPADAQDLLHHIANEELKPPVALLMYHPKELKQASYFPFAHFSPEWQAIQWALRQGKEVIFMDLPQGIHFTLDTEEAENTQTRIDTQDETTEQTQPILQDPLGYMARLAGYTDSERWWEITFEQREGHSATFEAIQELMTALRTELGKAESPRTLLREAFMRKTLRKAQKEYEKIAVVCGAWHGPALEPLGNFKATTDNQLLRGIKKTSTKATWVPWTYDRLATSSGYGAGVVSPAWYAMLFDNREEVVVRWMSKVSQLLRAEDMDSSSAHAIEAVRLAETLAALREHSVPGMDEMYEACLTIFCQGHPGRMELVERKLIVGDVMGSVPAEIPTIPLQQDLDKQIKTARLGKYRNTLEKQERELDLRQDTPLMASRLLHRMAIIGIPWGEVRKTRQNYHGRSQGDFKEVWALKWLPDFAIHIIEAGMWGNTVKQAAEKMLQHQSQGDIDLAGITRMVGQAIKAHLPEVMDALMGQFEQVATATQDVSQLMPSIPQLVEALRYANTRQADQSSLQKQLDQIITKVCIGLPLSCSSLNEESATDMFQLITQTDYHISIIQQAGHTRAWLDALHKTSLNPSVNGIIQGAVNRILYDRKEHSPEETRQRMHLNLSPGNDLQFSALWLAGFLHGSGLVLIHDPALWNVLDQWVDELPMDDLPNVLPVLRRTFSRFPDAEKQRMMSLADKGQLELTNDPGQSGTTPDVAVEVTPVLRLLLGIR